MNVLSPGVGFYAEMIRNDQPFAFVRYGNGEWDCILDLYYRTRSGSQHFSPSLRKGLARGLTHHHGGRYFLALQSLTFLKRLGILPQAEVWLAQNAPGIDWHDGEVFTKASMHGRLHPLVAAMQERGVVVVGPSWLRKLPFATAHVQVRSRDCWQDADAIAAQVRPHRGRLVSFSAGPAAKVLIHRLWPEMGADTWLIDFGSVWDPYGGKRSRQYHRRITRAVRRRNLRGK